MLSLKHGSFSHTRILRLPFTEAWLVFSYSYFTLTPQQRSPAVVVFLAAQAACIVARSVPTAAAGILPALAICLPSVTPLVLALDKLTVSFSSPVSIVSDSGSFL